MSECTMPESLGLCQVPSLEGQICRSPSTQSSHNEYWCAGDISKLCFMVTPQSLSNLSRIKNGVTVIRVHQGFSDGALAAVTSAGNGTNLEQRIQKWHGAILTPSRGNINSAVEKTICNEQGLLAMPNP